MDHFVYAYPWNVGNATDFANAVKALGLSGVNLAVSYHAGKFIQPGDPTARVVFPEDGTIYFQARRNYGRLQPQVASMCGERNIVADLVDELPVNGWMVLGHNSRLGFAHPDCVVRNAFGDPYYYSLCPSNPHVRAYSKMLAADFAANHNVHSLLLETPGFLTYAHGYHHEFAQIRPNPYLDALLGLCFCESCCDGAKADGIDANGLKRAVATRIDAYLSDNHELDHAEGVARLEEANAEVPGLGTYHRWRCDLVTALVAEIRREVREEVTIRTIATCQRPHATAYLEGMDLPALAREGDGVECPLYQPDLDGLTNDIGWLQSRINCSRNSAILRPAWPDWSDEALFRAAYAATRDAGFEQINFYNFGLLRPANRRWLQRLLTE